MRRNHGSVGGDWNSITKDKDCTRNAAVKISPSVKRLINTFDWTDCFRILHPNDRTFSRYYESQNVGAGA